MRTPVIACCDTPPILELSEHAFDFVALTVECFAVRMLGFAGLSGRYAGFDALVVIHLPFGKQQDQGQPVLIHHGMKLGVQTALRASETAGNSPFLSKLAAVR